MEKLNKEMEDFYKNLDVNAYKNDDNVDSIVSGMENIGITSQPRLEVKKYSNIYRSKIFQNCSSLNDKINFIDYKGYSQPTDSKVKDTLKTTVLFKIDNSNKTEFDKKLFNETMLENLDRIKKLNSKVDSKKNSAFQINSRLTTKIGNQYYHTKEQFDWEKVLSIDEFFKNSSLSSTFTDHSVVNNINKLYSVLNSTNFKKSANKYTYKLILLNKDGLFKSIFENLLENLTFDETDKLVVNEILSSKALDLKLDGNLRLERIVLKDNPNYKNYSSNIDLIMDSTSNPSFSSLGKHSFNLQSYDWGSYKYDTRYQIKQEFTIDAKSYNKFDFIQKSIEKFVYFDRRSRSNKIFLKCKRNQYRYIREKEIITYSLDTEKLKHFDFNIINYVEFFNPKGQSIDELCLRRSYNMYTSLAISSNLNEIVEDDCSKECKLELIDSVWDLGRWLANVASLCV
jgi:hypothetical protein